MLMGEPIMSITSQEQHSGNTLDLEETLEEEGKREGVVNRLTVRTARLREVREDSTTGETI